MGEYARVSAGSRLAAQIGRQHGHGWLEHRRFGRMDHRLGRTVQLPLSSSLIPVSTAVARVKLESVLTSRLPMQHPFFHPLFSLPCAGRIRSFNPIPLTFNPCRSNARALLLPLCPRRHCLSRSPHSQSSHPFDRTDTSTGSVRLPVLRHRRRLPRERHPSRGLHMVRSPLATSQHLVAAWARCLCGGPHCRLLSAVRPVSALGTAALLRPYERRSE